MGKPYNIISDTRRNNMENFDKKLNNYARLIIEKGINANDRPLVIRCAVERADFARLLVKYAYEKGCSEVIMEWNDDAINRMYYENASEEALKDFPDFIVEKSKYYFEKKAGVISVSCQDPENLKGVDPDRVQMRSKVSAEKMKPIQKYTMNDINSWCVVAAPSVGWAKRVFPELSEEEAVEKLWDQIFKATRSDTEDPIKAWDEHLDTMDKHAEFMNKHQFVKLHYTNSLGTDLTIELPKGHVWIAAQSTDNYGNVFVPNIPTEEVFTAPHKDKVNGVVYSTKPLNYGGNTIDKMRFEFKDGKVVDFDAEIGKETLKNMFDTDENGKYLGEVALVPYESPISKSNVTFIKTLYDENASCHLAFGQAYPTCVEGGVDMNEDELKEKGINDSLIHVDFMVGSEDMRIVGTTADGKEVEVFKEGNWAI